MTQNKNINLVPPKETLDKLDKEIESCQGKGFLHPSKSAETKILGLWERYADTKSW